MQHPTKLERVLFAKGKRILSRKRHLKNHYANICYYGSKITLNILTRTIAFTYTVMLSYISDGNGDFLEKDTRTQTHTLPPTELIKAFNFVNTAGWTTQKYHFHRFLVDSSFRRFNRTEETRDEIFYPLQWFCCSRGKKQLEMHRISVRALR